ncbi:MAG: FG-GAP repeat protein, partial [Rhodobacteraceae bacterium]|nr:FG-GAP repeat protein [Paracoccaceae bacterium]
MRSVIWLTSIVILIGAAVGAAEPIVVDTKLTASDAEELNEFGDSVSISGTTAIVGATGTDTLGG